MSDGPGRFHGRLTTAAGSNRATGSGAAAKPRVTPVRFGPTDAERLRAQALRNEIGQSMRWLISP